MCPLKSNIRLVLYANRPSSIDKISRRGFLTILVTISIRTRKPDREHTGHRDLVLHIRSLSQASIGMCIEYLLLRSALGTAHTKLFKKARSRGQHSHKNGILYSFGMCELRSVYLCSTVYGGTRYAVRKVIRSHGMHPVTYYIPCILKRECVCVSLIEARSQEL